MAGYWSRGDNSLDYDRVLFQNTGLGGELSRCRTEYEALVSSVREQQERLHATNTLRKKWETTLSETWVPVPGVSICHIFAKLVSGDI